LLLVPAPSRGRVERLLKYTAVQARWEPVPSPKTIRQSFTKNTRRSLFKNLETECSESELVYARGLLEKQEPAKVIATLLRMAEPTLPREPFELLPPPAVARPIASHGPRPAPASHQFTRFRLTWGANQGATANRALSHVCRRGGITKQAVGAIEVHEDSTVVEVAASEALRFERRVRLPDPRDPAVQIMRDEGGSRAPAPPRVGGGGSGGFSRLRPKTSRGPFPGRPTRGATSGPHGNAREGRAVESAQDTVG
jgi:ATP-dependent RNA helicase DeaD